MTELRIEPSAPRRAAAPPIGDANAKRLLVSVILGVVAFSSSQTIVSAVLSDIAADLHSSAGTLSWAVTGLFLTMAIGTPVMGRVGDAVGRRSIFLIGTATLMTATIACGLAWNAASFIAFRMIAGFGIACTMPNGMAIVIDAHTAERRAVALGWFQMVMGGAPVLALIVGAWLTDMFGWRSVFALLAPVAALGFVQGVRHVHEVGASRTGVSVDWWGATALGCAVLSFLLGLERLKRHSIGDLPSIALLVGAFAMALVFVGVERRVQQPLLRLDYFARRNFTGPLVAQPLAQFAYMGGFVMTPLMLKSEFGYGVGVSSWILLCRPGMFSALSPIGGRLATRLGTRAMVTAGSALMVVSMAAFALGAQRRELLFVIAGLLLSGAALGLATPSYATALASTVDPGDLGVANGMSSTLTNIGTLTGIQTMFVLLGDDRTPHAFERTFSVGLVVAAIGIGGGLMMMGRSRGGGRRPSAAGTLRVRAPHL